MRPRDPAFIIYAVLLSLRVFFVRVAVRIYLLLRNILFWYVGLMSVKRLDKRRVKLSLLPLSSVSV